MIAVLAVGSFLWSAPQADCPPVADFYAGMQQVMTLRATPLDSLWAGVQRALEDWHRNEFAASAKSGQVATLLPVEPDARQGAPSSVAPSARQTCYLARRVGSVDVRVAVLFIARPGPRPGTHSVEIRWLGGMKGSRERTWRPESAQAGALMSTLLQRLSTL